jgi:uncharacterized protein YndB with AHSA1/START domain
MVRSFDVVTHASVPPEQVFAVLADGAGWARWAGPLVPTSRWEREGDPPPGGIGAVRRLGAAVFSAREEIVAYDPPRRLAYSVRSGQPVRTHRADVLLEPDAGGTRIVWRQTFEPQVPGTGRLLTWWLRAVTRSFARRLVTFSERQRG